MRSALHVLVAALLLAPAAHAGAFAAAHAPQQQQQQQTPPPVPPPAAPVQETPALARLDLRAYEVGPDDTISVVIFGEPLPSRDYKIAPDGLINFPWIGNIKVAGLSVREVEAEIRKRLVDGGFLTKPQVNVEVTAYRSQIVRVTGQVQTPGDITLQGSEMTLSAALSRAQLLPMAGSYVEIRRLKPGVDPSAAGPDGYNTERVERADLDSLKVDPRLRDGDRIFVPKSPVFYISGHVKAGSEQVWVPGITVGKAIAAAGGLTDRGTLRGLKIKRMINGVFKEINAKQETLVQPEDQIIVKQKRF